MWHRFTSACFVGILVHKRLVRRDLEVILVSIRVITLTLNSNWSDFNSLSAEDIIFRDRVIMVLDRPRILEVVFRCHLGNELISLLESLVGCPVPVSIFRCSPEVLIFTANHFAAPILTHLIILWPLQVWLLRLWGHRSVSSGVLINLELQVLRLTRILVDLKATRVCLFVLIVQIALP